MSQGAGRRRSRGAMSRLSRGADIPGEPGAEVPSLLHSLCLSWFGAFVE